MRCMDGYHLAHWRMFSRPDHLPHGKCFLVWVHGSASVYNECTVGGGFVAWACSLVSGSYEHSPLLVHAGPIENQSIP
jgi:hypothetical protein